MDVAKMYERIGHLRALAEDPAATESEAQNARKRMEEIEARIRKLNDDLAAHRRKVADAIREEKAKKAEQRNTLWKIRRAAGPRKIFPVDWPFGWEKPHNSIDIEMLYCEDRSVMLGWKCPGCGLQVEREITPRHRVRLSGKPQGVENFIRDLKTGVLNQLCDECCSKYS
ncbi:MAG: hypothetical protein PHI12_13330 [Dehalococcoidales bacterium]|nr:hypothetical protein [Dehalococcoidales bacterium]